MDTTRRERSWQTKNNMTDNRGNSAEKDVSYMEQSSQLKQQNTRADGVE